MIGHNVNTRAIVGTLNGYNKQKTQKPVLWNTDFQSYQPPMAYKVLEQDKEGGAMAVMLVALILGLIIAGCLGTL